MNKKSLTVLTLLLAFTGFTAAATPYQPANLLEKDVQIEYRYTDTIQRKLNITQYSYENYTIDGYESRNISGYMIKPGRNVYLYKVTDVSFKGTPQHAAVTAGVVKADLEPNKLTRFLRNYSESNCGLSSSCQSWVEKFNERWYFKGGKINKTQLDALKNELKSPPIKGIYNTEITSGGIKGNLLKNDNAKLMVHIRPNSKGFARFKVGSHSTVFTVKTQSDWKGSFTNTTADRYDNSGNLGIGLPNGTTHPSKVLYQFRFDTQSAPLKDYSGNNADASVNGTPDFTATGIRDTNTWSFPGTKGGDNNAVIPDSKDNFGTKSLALSTFFYYAGTGGRNPRIVDDVRDCGSGTGGYQLFWSEGFGAGDNKLHLRWRTGGGSTNYIASSTLSTDTWYYAFATLNDGGEATLKVYNAQTGSLVSSSSASSVAFGGECGKQGTYIADSTGDDEWNGKIENLIVYTDSSLTKSNSGEFFNSGSYKGQKIDTSSGQEWQTLEVDASLNSQTASAKFISLDSNGNVVDTQSISLSGGNNNYTLNVQDSQDARVNFTFSAGDYISTPIIKSYDVYYRQAQDVSNVTFNPGVSITQSPGNAQATVHFNKSFTFQNATLDSNYFEFENSKLKINTNNSFEGYLKQYNPDAGVNSNAFKISGNVQQDSNVAFNMTGLISGETYNAFFNGANNIWKQITSTFFDWSYDLWTGTNTNDTVRVENEESDTTPPTTTDDWSSTGWVQGSSADVQLDGSDSVSGVEYVFYKLDGEWTEGFESGDVSQFTSPTSDTLQATTTNVYEGSYSMDYIVDTDGWDNYAYFKGIKDTGDMKASVYLRSNNAEDQHPRLSFIDKSTGEKFEVDVNAFTDEFKIIKINSTGSKVGNIAGNKNNNIQENTWYKVVFSYDRSADDLTAKLYQSGNLIDTISGTHSVSYNVQRYGVAAYRNTAHFDNFKVFNEQKPSSDPVTVSIDSEGNHTLVYHSEDQAGNVESDSTEYVALDGTPPSTSDDWTTNGWVTSSPQSVDISASDSLSGVDQIFYSKDGVSIQSTTNNPATISFSSDGNHSFTYYADDTAGNTANSKTDYVAIDTTNPSSSDNYTTNGWQSKDSVTVKVTASDSTSGVDYIEYQVNNGGWQQVSGTSATFTVGAEGNNTIEYRATDIAGNTESIQTDYVALDTVNPSTSDDYTKSGWQDQSSLQVNLSASDSTSGVDYIEYRVDGSTWNIVDGSTAAVDITTEGNHTVEYRSTDFASNTESIQTEYVALDDTVPTSSDNYTKNGWLNESSVKVQISTSDSFSGVQDLSYRVNGGAWNTVSSTSTTITVSSNGNNTLEYNATDVAGNVESTETDYIALDDETPTSTVNKTTSGWLNKDSLSLEVTATDSYSGVDYIETVLSGLTTYTSGTSTTLQVTADGNNTLKFRANDTAGNLESYTTEYYALDTENPVYQNLDDNSSNGLIEPGDSLNITVEFKDGLSGINKAVLATNESGTWKNYTTQYGSPYNFNGESGVYKQAQFTWDNDSQTNDFYYRVWGKDDVGNWRKTTAKQIKINVIPDLTDYDLSWKSIGGSNNREIDITIDDGGDTDVNDYDPAVPSGTVSTFTNSSLVATGFNLGSEFSWNVTVTDTFNTVSNNIYAEFTTEKTAILVENSTQVFSEDKQAVKTVATVNITGDAADLNMTAKDPTSFIKEVKSGKITEENATDFYDRRWEWTVDSIRTTIYPVQQNTLENSTLDKQYIYRYKEDENIGKVDYSSINITAPSIPGNCQNCDNRIQNIPANTAVNNSYESNGDFLNETNYEFTTSASEVTLGTNYIGQQDLEVNNTIDTDFSSIETKQAVSEPDKCTQANNTEINIGNSSVENYTVQLNCDPGTPGSPILDLTDNNDGTVTVWFNTTATVYTNETSQKTIVWKIDEDNLKEWDNRIAGTTQQVVNGKTDDLYFNDGIGFVYFKIPSDFQNSSLHAGKHKLAFKYKYEGNTTEDTGGQTGGDTGPSTEPAPDITFTESPNDPRGTPDTIDLTVTPNSTGRGSFSINNFRTEAVTVTLTLPDTEACRNIKIERTSRSNVYGEKGTYRILSAGQSLTGNQYSVTVDYKATMPPGVDSYSCNVKESVDIGVVEDLKINVTSELGLLGKLEGLYKKYTPLQGKLWKEDKICLDGSKLSHIGNETKIFNTENCKDTMQVVYPTPRGAVAFGFPLILLIVVLNYTETKAEERVKERIGELRRTI